MKAFNKTYSLFIILLFFLNTSSLLSQQLISQFNIKSGFSFTSNFKSINDNLPFWFHTNKNGSIDKNSANINNYLSLKADFYRHDLLNIIIESKFINRVAYTGSTHFEIGSIKLQFQDFAIMAGRFYDPLTIKENHLSIGSFMYSNNAIPLPKIAITTNDYVSIPKTNDVIRLNAFLAHGWFNSDRWIQKVYLHEKYLYLNVNYKFFDAKAGIVHNVQWGGHKGSYILPNDIRTYFEVIMAKGSSSKNAPTGEASNVVGNSVGMYDFNLGLTFKNFVLSIYRVFYLEDKVSTRFRSPWDGLWGLVIKPNNSISIKNIIWEHINTKKMDSFDWEPKGTANYYNHRIYQTGWTYKNRVIGNPLILANNSLSLPIYNNIIVANHIGFDGVLVSNIAYQFLYTFSRNYGTFNDQIIRELPSSECPPIELTVCAELRSISQLKKINHSIYSSFKFQSKYDRLNYGFSLSSDIGKLYDKVAGISIFINYNFEYINK
tara:strand:+ start:3824 stop:5293 length:1470 start_codon:yes stop_codon:yes gene_type:complete